MDRYVAHQVSQVHTAAMCRTLGIDPTRVPRTFPTRGNMGPASIPFTLATQVDALAAGDRVLLHGRRVRPQRLPAWRWSGERRRPRTSRPRRSPPAGLPGLDPSWSRLVTRRRRGSTRTWHVLDNGVAAATGTLLCVHGNPTWSYLWRRFLAAAPRRAGGWSPSTSSGWASPSAPGRRARSRSASPTSTAVVDALDVTGPVVTAGHDWGGVISLGWALAHRDRSVARPSCSANTAVRTTRRRGRPSLTRSPPAGTAPGAVGRARGLHRPRPRSSARSALSRPALPRACATPSPRRTAAAGGAPSAVRRRHPARTRARQRGDAGRHRGGSAALADVPVLMLWGPRDPVFSDRYLRDLRARLPHADVHRYERASHLVTGGRPAAAR